ncbi:ABC transporter substrate-binding protein [Fodinicola feengrottensis]|uniref:ABC transporter substrate-binding protein n=1 Tax=Fodinicola feengrottensis TaxID=435914 RepID=A0ABN2G6L9_9ACTN
MDRTPVGLSRRSLLTAGAGLTALGLAGCGAGSQPGSAETGPAEGSIALLTPIFDGTDGKHLLESVLLPKFRQQYPKVTVSVDYTTYDKLDAKITTGLAGGAPPDVLMLGVGWVEPFAARNVLRELTPAPSTGTYAADILDSCRYGGKLYALPVMLDSRMGLYRKDLLGKAGLTKPPSTLDEIRQYAVQLTDRQGGRLNRTGLDFLSLDTRQMFETVLFAFGGALFTAGKPTFQDERGVAALQWLTDLQRKDKVIDAGFSSTTTTSLPIADGRAAMAVAHNNWWPTILKTHPETKDQLAPFLFDQSKPSIFAGGTLVSVSAQSQHPWAAQALARYLGSADVSLAASQQRGNVPAQLSSLDSPYVKGDPLVQFALSNLKYARHEGGTPAWLQIRSEFKAAVQAALLGQQSPKQALDALAKTATAAIANAAQK